MKRRGLVTVVVALIVAGGCAEPSGPANPPTYETVEAASLKVQVVPAGAEMPELPTVRLYRTPGKTGIEGVTVSFTLERNRADRTTVSVVTNSDGIAKLPGWMIGSEPGAYTATAVVQGMHPVIFRAVILGEVVAIYDLETLDGHRLPTYGVKEAHYVLYEGGVFNVFFDTPQGPFTVEPDMFGTYDASVPSIVSFSIADRTGSFSWAASPQTVNADIDGRAMTILRGHPLDWPVERYMRR